MKQRYLFLDIDGVLTFTLSSLFISGMRAPFMGRFELDEFDPSALALLKRVIELLDLKVILASTWAFGATQKDLDKLGKTLGIEFSGMIRDDFGRGRSSLIDDYIKSHSDVKDYFIIDDEDGSFVGTHNQSRLIHTPDGINYKTVEAIGRLYDIDMWMLSAQRRKSSEDSEDKLWVPTISS